MNQHIITTKKHYSRLAYLGPIACFLLALVLGLIPIGPAKPPLPIAPTSAVAARPPYDYTCFISARSTTLGTKMYTSLAGAISGAVTSNCKKYRLPPALILGIMEAESEFNPQAVSGKNARGLMQINLAANGTELKEILPAGEVYDPVRNVEAGCYLLRKFLNRDKNLDKALTAYLGGSVKEYKDKVLTATGRALIEEGEGNER